MLGRELSIARCRGLTRGSELLAAGELIASLAEATGRDYLLVCRWPREAIVYGLYSSHRREYGGSVERRITGGNTAIVSRDHYYVALAVHGIGSLNEAVVKASQLALCISASTYGATMLGEIGFAELFTERSIEVRELEECLSTRIAEGPTVNPSAVAPTAKLFEQDTWRYYSFNEGSAWGEVRRGDYYLRLSVTVSDGYIVDWSLDSNMMAAPPMEVFSVLASVKGSPFHELTLSNLQLALEKRLQLHGIGVEDFANLLNKLYSRVGLRYFT